MQGLLARLLRCWRSLVEFRLSHLLLADHSFRVQLRVISWITFYSMGRMIHGHTRNITNQARTQRSM